ncbi:hypothetical protein [Streptomyces alkaliterrae]|nr:hypothetical protein [Streptomyces alkaliterrae]
MLELYKKGSGVGMVTVGEFETLGEWMHVKEAGGVMSARVTNQNFLQGGK